MKAIRSAIRNRRSRSQRAGALSRCSTTGSTLTAATLPDRSDDPDPRPHAQRAGSRLSIAAVVKEAVDSRPGPAHVRAKRALFEELGDQQRPPGRDGQVIGWKGREISRATHSSQRLEEGRAPLFEVLSALHLVKPFVDVSGRALLREARKGYQDPEVLRQLEHAHLLAAALGQLRSRGEEEGNVCADFGGNLAELLLCQRLLERAVGERESGAGVGAAASQAGGERNALP